MKWRNVKLILSREIRDQLRDRRTLFTVLVLPVLLYPLLGMALLQVSQFARKQEAKIWLVGDNNLPSSPELLDGENFHPDLLEGIASRLTVHVEQEDDKLLALIREFQSGSNEHGSRFVDQVFQQELQQRRFSAAVVVSDPIVESSVEESDSYAGSQLKKPAIQIFCNTANEQSAIAAADVARVLENLQSKITAEKLASLSIQPASLNSFSVSTRDVAEKKWKRAATWSRILPFVVMIWALTGAFYPAVDLCAGEKERGTFETLLSSPAGRSEIAIGKLLTVIAFSLATSLLNLVSMGFTGLFVASKLGAHAHGAALVSTMGVPPLASLGWLLLAMIPVSALFSAVALAAASFARSSKEGQYYLVPLMMISMPLMMIPMMPAAKLDLGSSLIPVAGLMLMLRGLIEGQYTEVFKLAGPTIAVTLVCCWLAIRWVVIQFNRESVIFRPSERFSVNVWLKEVFRERADMPLIEHAIFCGVLILVIRFFMSASGGAPQSWIELSTNTVIELVASIAVPAIMMALVLTRRPLKSLKLVGCRLPEACAAVLAAICLHPAVTWLATLVLTIYPPSAELSALDGFISEIFSQAPGFWAILLVLAVAPAICEELAFRGFILSGLQSMKSDFKAIAISSLMFGAAHLIFQQSIITFFIGCILGLIAIRTGSLIPCVLYHVVHNGLSTGISMMDQSTMVDYPLLGLVFEAGNSGSFEYDQTAAILMAVTGVLLLSWFWNNKPRDVRRESVVGRGTLEVPGI